VVDKSRPVVVDDNCRLVVVENNIHPANVQEKITLLISLLLIGLF
jgi:hypothetical protein